MNCAWDLLETSEFFLICQCFRKQAKDAGTFCPAIKKSHSWNSNSKCLEKKHTSQPQSQQRLSWCTLVLLSLSLSLLRKYTPLIDKTIKRAGLTPAPGNRGPSSPSPAWPPLMWISSVTLAGNSLFLPSSPTFHNWCCLWYGAAYPKQLATQFPRRYQLNTFYPHPDLDWS